MIEPSLRVFSDGSAGGFPVLFVAEQVEFYAVGCGLRDGWDARMMSLLNSLCLSCGLRDSLVEGYTAEKWWQFHDDGCWACIFMGGFTWW